MARLWHALTLASALAVGAGDRASAQAPRPAPSSPPDPAAVLLPPVATGQLPVRAAAPASDNPLPSREPAARLVLDGGDFTTVRSAQFEDARRGSPTSAGEDEDGLAYLTDGFYHRGADGRAERTHRVRAEGDSEGGLTHWFKKTFGRDDEGRGPFERGGHAVDEAINRRERRMFESDPDFCDWVSPLSNPFFFEDPRSLTESRGIGFYQSIPSDDPFFRGGSAWFFGGQARLAITPRISLVIHKMGIVSVNPGEGSVYGGGTGLSEFWIGPKVVLYRDVDTKTLVTVGTQFQIPMGGDNVFQNTGKLSIVPYVTAGQRLLGTEIGTLNGMATAGYSFSTNRDRSDFFYSSFHVDFDIANGHRFYPIAELNWFSYTTNGQARPITTEGRDFANIGAGAKGNNLVTWALGMRWKSFNKRFEVGGGYEGFMFGQKGLFDGRFTLDIIWRY